MLFSAQLLATVLLERFERLGLSVVSFYDTDYPGFLTSLDGLPLLWTAGDRSLLQDRGYCFAESPVFAVDLLEAAHYPVVLLTDLLWEALLNARWRKPLQSGQLLLVSPLEPKALWSEVALHEGLHRDGNTSDC